MYPQSGDLKWLRTLQKVSEEDLKVIDKGSTAGTITVPSLRSHAHSLWAPSSSEGLSMHRADKDMFHHIRTGQTQSATNWNESCMSQHICSHTSWLALPLFPNTLTKAQKCPSSETSGNILWYVEVHKAAMFKCLCVWISNYAEYCSSSPSLIWMNLLSKQRINNSLWASTSHSPPFLLFLCSPLLLHLPFPHPARPLLIHFFIV